MSLAPFAGSRGRDICRGGIKQLADFLCLTGKMRRTCHNSAGKVKGAAPEHSFPHTTIKPANEVENVKTQSRIKKRFPFPFQKDALVLPGQNLLSA
ncbi:hypothetical protein [Erwinia sp. CGal63]|uniref:hypothetical protein n=1 Tax=Erwinia sp. CGal63 TaxID=2919889 RepID=UPI00300AD08E